MPSRALIKFSIVKTVLSFTLFTFSSLALALPLIKLQFQPFLLPNTSPLTNITSIFQDKQGLIWFGTENGLLSYDGNQSTLYAHNKTNTKSLSSNKILRIAQDMQGDIWVATSDGLNKLSRDTQEFAQYLIRPKSKNGYVNNYVYDVYVDNRGTIWAATASGLFRYQEKKDTFKAYRPWHPKYSNDNLDIWAQAIFEDAKGIIWLGTSAGGIIRFDPSDEKFKHFSSHPDNNNYFPSDFINVIRNYSADSLLVGTDSGLIHFKPQSGKASYVLKNRISQRVNGLAKDKSGSWWVNTETHLLKLSPDLTLAENYAPQSKRSADTIENFPTALLIDNESNIWSAFKDDGLHFLSSDAKVVRTIKFDNNRYSNNFLKINQVLESNDRLIVTTTNNLAIIPAKNSNELPKNYGNESSQKLGEYFGIDSPNKDTIYAGRFGGFSVIDRSGEINHFKTNIALPTRQIFIDYKNQTWLLIEGKGVLVYGSEAEDKIFQSVQQKLVGDYKSTAISMTISADRKSLYILYSNKGLFRYNIESNQFNRINGTESEKPYTNLQVKNDGLYLFNGEPNVRQFDFLTQQINFTSLPTTNLNCLVEGLKNQYWLAQRKGQLFQWDASVDRITKIRKSQGAPEKGLTGRHCLKIQDGGLLFTSYQGLLYIPSNTETNNHLNINTTISSVIIGQKKEQLPTNIFANNALFSSYINQPLTLDYDNRPLVINFSSLSYKDIAEHKFKYRFKGIEDSWTETDAHKVSLAYLPVGDFSFEVYSADAKGNWATEPASLNISVTPPFWLTLWAKIFYVLLLGLLIALVFHLKTVSILKRASQLEEQVKVRTQELAKEKETVEQLLAQKNDEFANVSHEFRTPLTLILGPIKNLLRSNLRSSTRQKLEMVKRNGYRLLRMVDQILHMEKFRVQHIINDRPIDVKPIAMLIAESFADLAKEKQIDFKVEIIEDVRIKFTLEAFEKILLNLLSNALKYTPSGGKISFCIQTKDTGFVSITVADSGIGIPLEHQSKIFERFNRVLDENSEKITGAGIGLALVKELVESHQGHIKLQSAPGKGSVFTVELLQLIDSQDKQSRSTFNSEMLELEIESIRGQELIQDHSLKNQIPPEVTRSNYDEQTKTTILVIEDNTDMRNYIVDSIDDKYHCLEAADGKAGVVTAVNAIPDLVVSDVMMPEMDGYQVCQTLKGDEKTSHIPLILLTARGDKQSRMRGWQEHADEYLTKPFDSDELNIRIENLLSIRNILRSRFSHESIEQQSAEKQQRAGLSEKDRAFIQKLNLTCENNYTNADFETVKIAEAMFMSERQFQRKLKALLDRSPTDYLRIFRLHKAKTLLSEGGRISDIAMEVGFSSQAYFSKCFKAQFGMTAKAYQTSDKSKSQEQSESTTADVN